VGESSEVRGHKAGVRPSHSVRIFHKFPFCDTQQLMSALGQNQTLRQVSAMSALPPKTDIRRQPFDVGFGPLAEVYVPSIWQQAIPTPQPNCAPILCLFKSMSANCDKRTFTPSSLAPHEDFLSPAVVFKLSAVVGWTEIRRKAWRRVRL